tara:strand:+ start:131 stop:382 length:252 start_codon:yes stop_codon:yes gene_type:complete
MRAGDASVKHVEDCLQNEFVYIFGDAESEKVIEPTHILNKVEWYESSQANQAYPVLIIEPIYKSITNNLICLCPPFDASNYSE